jgi:hypothetical protein
MSCLLRLAELAEPAEHRCQLLGLALEQLIAEHSSSSAAEFGWSAFEVHPKRGKSCSFLQEHGEPSLMWCFALRIPLNII